MWWSVTTMLGGTMLNGCPTPRDKLTNSARPQNARTGRRKLQTVERAWWVGASYRQLMQCISATTSALHGAAFSHAMSTSSIYTAPGLYYATPVFIDDRRGSRLGRVYNRHNVGRSNRPSVRESTTANNYSVAVCTASRLALMM